MQRQWTSRPALALAVLVAALAGCGDDDDPVAGGGGAGGGTLTISSANPATENTTVDTAKAATLGNDARAADAFSAVPYCEVFAEAAPGANGRLYAVQVYFRQSDKAALHVSVVGSATASAPPSYVVFDNNGGAPITNVTVAVRHLRLPGQRHRRRSLRRLSAPGPGGARPAPPCGSSRVAKPHLLESSFGAAGTGPRRAGCRQPRRARTAVLRICSTASESPQPRQASVMLWP